VQVTTEAVIGTVNRALTAPRALLLGRYDQAGRLQYVGRSTRTVPGRQPGKPH
jgi:hypothetical protein